jgi:hypothetical protein
VNAELATGAGSFVLTCERSSKNLESVLSFDVREDHLSRLTIGETVSLMRDGADDAIKAVIPELRPLGLFATWQAERVIGDHDRNTLRLRLDRQLESAGLAAFILCGAGPASAFVHRGFQMMAGERCGEHLVAAYLAKVNAMKRQLLRLAANGRN